MLWYSLEAPEWGASNEYPQHMFLWTNKKNINIFWLKKVPYLKLILYNTCLSGAGGFDILTDLMQLDTIKEIKLSDILFIEMDLPFWPFVVVFFIIIYWEQNSVQSEMIGALGQLPLNPMQVGHM